MRPFDLHTKHVWMASGDRQDRARSSTAVAALSSTYPTGSHSSEPSGVAWNVAKREVCTKYTLRASDWVVLVPDWPGFLMFPREPCVCGGRNAVRVPPRAQCFRRSEAPGAAAAHPHQTATSTGISVTTCLSVGTWAGDEPYLGSNLCREGAEGGSPSEGRYRLARRTLLSSTWSPPQEGSRVLARAW
jgi:hypothetical protein